MPVYGRSGGPFGDLASCLIDGDDGVCPLVRIDSNDDHFPVFLFAGDGLGPVGGHV
jgi:hypothetical protein